MPQRAPKAVEVQPGLYRSQALRHASSPEGLDELMHVTSSRAWLALLACGVVITFAVIWAIFGNLTISARGDGMLMRPLGLQQLTVPENGTLVHLFLRSGQNIKAGQPIATERLPTGAILTLRANTAGTLEEVSSGSGGYVRAGDSLGRLDEIGQPLEALIFVSTEDARSLAAGMPAEIWPQGAGSHGFIYGRVRSVSRFPSSPERLQFLFHNDALQNDLTRGLPVHEVDIELAKAPTPSGVRWSVRSGPAGHALTAGILCTARMIVKRMHPIDLLYPQE